MNADVFITIVLAALVVILTAAGVWAALHSVRADRERATRAPQDR